VSGAFDPCGTRKASERDCVFYSSAARRWDQPLAARLARAVFRAGRFRPGNVQNAPAAFVTRVALVVGPRHKVSKMTEIPAHPIFRDRPPPEAKLWRYLSFAKFAALLDAGQLHFTRVDKFDDHFEGAWPQKDYAKWQKVEPAQEEGVFTVNSFTETIRPAMAVSCWVESEYESAAMWRLYSSGSEGVAVVTSFRKLEEAVSQHVAQQSDWLGGVGRVRYFDHFNEELLEDGENNLLWPFMMKYVSYAHEREVRALVNAPWGQNIAAGGLDLPIQLTDFIDQIVTNPFGQPWFDKAVGGMAERYGLGDRIRSSLLAPANFYMTRQKK
jgi:hypothetical protein